MHVLGSTDQFCSSNRCIRRNPIKRDIKSSKDSLNGSAFSSIRAGELKQKAKTFCFQLTFFRLTRYGSDFRKNFIHSVLVASIKKKMRKKDEKIENYSTL
jgi:hypothetical protein